MISKIVLENFSAFKNIELDCSPQINIIVGENSCGKTQILKAAYALSKISTIKNDKGSEEIIKRLLTGLFKPRSRMVGGLVNRHVGSDCKIAIEDSYGIPFGLNIQSKSDSSLTLKSGQPVDVESGVFIPTKEVLTLLPAIESGAVDAKQLKALFDGTVVDLCNAFIEGEEMDEKQLLKNDQRLGGVLKSLVENVGGQYRYRDNDHYFVAGKYEEYKEKKDDFWFKSEPGSELSTTMTAEGYRKIGMLQQLILNGGINSSAKSSLFWDEPEANLNPKLMKMVVKSLLEISRNGKQVFIATHEYVLLKWFDLLANKDERLGDSIRYHLLSKDPETGEITCESSDDYCLIS
ncbi:AAA family ATPase [Marinomonas primoryensis]|uniref:AAA family ATPase n=1 Tax=Marinomonas primoryensis TaxID=178399 RepID=UPI000DD2B7E8|nr:AAA family ATPase [Marinomonas primoryensis]